MSKFHSTVSRRTFMKGLGLAGAGLGAAVAAAPVFHDLDEVAASPNDALLHPWWVKEREHLDPTTETDWSILEPWDWNYEPSNTHIANPAFRTFAPYGGPEVSDAEMLSRIDMVTAFRTTVVDAERSGGINQSGSGWELKDVALRTACRLIRGSLKSTDGMGYKVTTPEERGTTPWTGTADENARLVRSALHFIGMPTIGFLEMDPNLQKLFYPTKTKFEMATGDPYKGTDGRYVIPSNLKYMIVAVTRKEAEYGSAYGIWPSRPYGYDMRYIFGHRVQAFIKSLGYKCLWATGSFGGAMNVPLGVMSGNNELGRISHSVNPKYGVRIVSNNVWLTDLPLPATKPIDAGIFKFCATCKQCAITCSDYATGGISMEDATYDITGPWNRVGIKAYHITWPLCGSCGLCTQTCPFNHKDDAYIHDLASAVIATTPIFNSFMATMDGAFGYGDVNQFNADEWWNRDLRTYRYDTINSGENRR